MGSLRRSSGTGSGTGTYTLPNTVTKYLGVWNATGTTYSINNLVSTSDGSFYISLINSNLNYDPATNPSRWRKVSGSGIKWVYESIKNTRSNPVTSITVSTYDTTNDKILVYVEGILLNSGDVTKTNSTTITIPSTPVEYDIVIQCLP